MDQLPREERHYLKEIVRLFEHPTESARRHRKISYLLLSIGAILVLLAGVFSNREDEAWKTLLPFGAGVFTGFGLVFRSSARQIPVLIKFSELKAVEAKAAIEN